MTLGEWSQSEILRRTANEGLVVRVGPFTYRLHTSIRRVAESIAFLYSDFPADQTAPFADFHVSLVRGQGILGPLRPGASFLMGGRAAFNGFPRSMAVPYMEWGMNWCVSQHAHQFLILHGAVVERGGEAAIVIAQSGGGKSTLAAALALSGWRLLSDELALVAPRSGNLTGLARPISLKNESIELIRRFSPSARIGVASTGAPKGTVAHLRPPASSVRDVLQPARPRWIILLNFDSGADARLNAMSKPQTMISLARNSFNYGLLGRRGFDALGNLVDACDCYEFSYGRIADAIETFDRMASDRGGDAALQGSSSASGAGEILAGAETG